MFTYSQQRDWKGCRVRMSVAMTYLALLGSRTAASLLQRAARRLIEKIGLCPRMGRNKTWVEKSNVPSESTALCWGKWSQSCEPLTFQLVVQRGFRIAELQFQFLLVFLELLSITLAVYIFMALEMVTSRSLQLKILFTVPDAYSDK